MVATRLTLLSLAAASSCMFGAFKGAPPRSGRLERRLTLLGREGSNLTTSVLSIPSSPTSPSSPSTPSTPTSALSPPPPHGQGEQQDGTFAAFSAASEVTSSTSSERREYTYPAEFMTGGVGTTYYTGPANTLDPTRSPVDPEESSGSVPPPETLVVSTSTSVGSTSFSATVTRDNVPQVPPLLSPASSSLPLGPDSAPEATKSTATTTGKKGPPPIPSKATNQTVKTTTTIVDLSRTTRPPATTTTAGKPWDPSGEPDWSSMSIPPDVAAGWSSTRTANKTWDWGHPTTTVEEINTWTDVPWTDGWVTITGTEEPISAETGRATSPVSYCEESDKLKAPTVYSIVHTSTITWTGDPRDYTPPYPPLTTPASCVPTEADSKSPVRMTMSRCTSTGTLPIYRTCEVTTTTMYMGSISPKLSYIATMTGTDAPTASKAGNIQQPVVTFITTDKNPAVVFPGQDTMSTPDYGGGGASKTAANQNTKEAAGGTANPVPTNDKQGPHVTSVAGLPPPITVTVQPSTVIIGGQTITDNPALRTQVVNVNGELFTINPSQVIGAGATIERPASSGSGAGAGLPPVFSPTTTTVGGVPIYVSSRVAVIDGTTFSLDGSGAGGTTKVVAGDKTVSIGPEGVVVVVGGGAQAQTAGRLSPTASNTAADATAGPRQTEIVVAGGELVTAVGQSVLVVRGTTITYGINTAGGGGAAPAAVGGGGSMAGGTTTMTVNGEVITLSPQGVSVHGTVLGGPSARSTDTQLEIVGGATITQIGPSLVVISGTTYTVGPGAPSTTVVVGGETVTLGPAGVTVSTLSFRYPLGPTSVTVLQPGPSVAAATAGVTAGRGESGSGGSGSSGGGGEEDAAAGLRPPAVLVLPVVLAVGLGWWL